MRSSLAGLNPVAFACWALTTVLLLPAFVLRSIDTDIGVALVLQAVIVVHTGTALAWTLSVQTVRLMSFGFWLFGYIWFGLAPLAMLATDRYPLSFVVPQGMAVTACVIVECGMLAYSTGSVLAARRPNRRSTLLEPLLARRVSHARLLMLCLLAVLLAAVLIPGQGGIGTFFASRQAANEAGGAQGTDTATRALAAWSLSVPAFWALLTLLHVPRHKSGDRLLRGLRWALLPLMLALNVVVNNPISQPRFWAGTVLLTLLFAAPSMRRPRGFRVGAAAILLAVLIVFPYSDYFRNEDRGEVEVVSLAEQFTTNGDYDAYQQVQTGVSLSAESSLLPEAALGPPLFFVPRAVWPGKPEDTGIRLAQHAGYDFENLSAPLWIESYLWAGFPCVIAVFALYGALSRRIDDVRNRLREEAGTLAALLVPALAFYQLILLRGSLMASMGPLALMVLVPVLVSARGRRPSRDGGRVTLSSSRPRALPCTRGRGE